MDYVRVLTITFILVSLIYLPNPYSALAQSQSIDSAGAVINASDINGSGQSSVEDSQSSPSPSFNSTGPVQSSSALTNINEQQESIDSDTLLQRLQNPIVGSFGDDRITGTQQPDIIIGFSGSDTISGLNGSDVIQGNEGQDKLYGDEGDDILQGGIGSDQLFGGLGNDILAGGPDDDFLVGGEGNDKLYGDMSDDILVGGPGADYFDCGEGVDVVVDFSIQQGDDRAGNCEELIELR